MSQFCVACFKVNVVRPGVTLTVPIINHKLEDMLWIYDAHKMYH